MSTLSPTGALGAEMGDGKENTATIVAYLGTGEYAAKLCDDFVSGGYSDWYLPSSKEMSYMSFECKGLLTTHGTTYWSSSEDPNNPEQAYRQNDTRGSQPIHKATILRVWPIRRF